MTTYPSLWDLIQLRSRLSCPSVSSRGQNKPSMKKCSKGTSGRHHKLSSKRSKAYSPASRAPMRKLSLPRKWGSRWSKSLCKYSTWKNARLRRSFLICLSKSSKTSQKSQKWMSNREHSRKWARNRENPEQ